MKFQSIILSIFILLTANVCYSQSQAIHNIYFTLPEIALLDIEPNTRNIIFEFKSPDEPGDKLTRVKGETKWLNYTSALSLGGSPKVITAHLENSKGIPGLTIELTVSKYSGNGRGVLGTPAGTIKLSSAAQKIIYGIGGCFTGDGTNRGHEIEYNAYIHDYSIFEIPTTTTMEVVFTITN